jgi:rhodanese-related sulfurtransferase
MEMTMKIALLLILFLISTSIFAQAEAPTRTVKITRDLEAITVKHAGQPVVIERNQDTLNTIDFTFMQTSRPCPPFCVQPMNLGGGVETLGELEFLNYLQQAQVDENILIIDSRTEDEYATGTIPSAKNLPWELLFPARSDPATINRILTEQFAVKKIGEGEDFSKIYDFSAAKTLVLFCNGLWCGQSPTNIRSLLALGYPGEKIKWYRGGMQAWHQLGLTVLPGFFHNQ